jgi:hypothetical protein
MVDPGHYQVLSAAAFDDDLAAIEVAMRSMGDAARHEQVNQYIARLDDLRREPRHKRHWSQRILVYRDEAGSLIGREKVADDADLDESDLRRLEYVIENRLDDEGVRPRQQWGLLVAFYKVDDEDRRVSLLSIHLMVTRE